MIDVGINSVDGRIVGDVDFEDCSEVTNQISPVPKGIGPVTTSVLLSNLVECWRKQIPHNEASTGANIE